MTDTKTLFTAHTLGELELRNRLVLAPMTRTSAQEDGLVHFDMVDYYRDFARGDFSLLVTEGLYTDEAFSQGYANQPGLATQAQQDSWRPVVEAVHQQGGRLIAQLMHAGAQTQHNRFKDEVVASSESRASGEMLSFYGGSGPFPLAREITESEIHEAIAGFATSARLAREAGFDGVELHGANGYLIHQFISERFNQRDDAWGGDATARLAFPLAVIRSVREAVGDDFPLGMRLSQGTVTEPDHSWAGGPDAARARFSHLIEAGLDFLHLTGGDVAAPAFPEAANADERSLSLTALADQSRKALESDITLITNGGVDSPEKAVAALEHADLVAIGRSALANHDWPKRVKRDTCLTPFDFAMLSPLATLANEEDWRIANDKPANCEGRC
ncbi:NADH:flavin oxidoreductase [Cobetia marina]|uniref:oxidoreductase n=1 Tax=Cobetia marina TaxID=28258 RepID=UPI0010AE507C|nr:NADH:flavin oxidoreductase [Cobetia marina]TKD64283.1 NADH:flavin oxidoreductase [Cobetia marina]